MDDKAKGRGEGEAGPSSIVSLEDSRGGSGHGPRILLNQLLPVTHLLQSRKLLS